MSIELNACSHAFGKTPVLDRVDLSVARGEFVALLGPSGSGKSTLLRLVAGLEPMQRGALHLHGEDVTTTSVQERGVGLVFQHYALFPHLDVFNNIAFGLRLRARRQKQLSQQDIRERVQVMLEMVELAGFEHRRPSELSGGQQQRVALARALVVEPRVLLLDEPFGALDARVRITLRRAVRRLHDQLGMTTLLVTHDQGEAVDVADRLVLLREGRVCQAGTPDDLFSAPADPFVCEFLGEVNWLEGRIEGTTLVLGGQRLEGVWEARVGQAKVGVRPRQFSLTHNAREGVTVTVTRVRHLGRTTRIEAELGSGPLIAEVARGESSEALQAGQKVVLHVKRAHVFLGDETPSSWLAQSTLTHSTSADESLLELVHLS